ncbi:MAG: TIGR04211 family SH3 domain-containing protein [Pseudomonadales bacterium]
MNKATITHWRTTLAALLAVAATAGGIVPTPGFAAEAGRTLYVSDELVITFRTQPSTRGEIIRNLAAGTSVEVVQMRGEEDWALVRLGSGLEGWVRKQYLQNEPVARDRLQAANREVAQLTRTVADLRERLGAVQSARTEAEQSSSNLDARVSELTQELAEIKQVSASALETAAENRRLTDLNARLRDELDTLVEERDRLAADSQQRGLLVGGGLVLAGLFLGMILKARPRRSAWS